VQRKGGAKIQKCQTKKVFGTKRRRKLKEDKKREGGDRYINKGKKKQRKENFAQDSRKEQHEVPITGMDDLQFN